MRLTENDNAPFTLVFPQEQREEEMRQHLQTLMIAEAPAQENSGHVPEP